MDVSNIPNYFILVIGETEKTRKLYRNFERDINVAKFAAEATSSTALKIPGTLNRRQKKINIKNVGPVTTRITPFAVGRSSV